MAKPARSVLLPPYPSLLFICTPNNGKANPKRLRKTDAAERALAAYANTSTRYSCIGRKMDRSPKLLLGKRENAPWSGSERNNVGLIHYARKNPGTYNWHDPVNFSLCGPTIPAEVVSSCQHRNGDRVKGLTANPLARRTNRRSELGFASQVYLCRHFGRLTDGECVSQRALYTMEGSQLYKLCSQAFRPIKLRLEIQHPTRCKRVQ